MPVAKYYDPVTHSWVPVSYGGNSTIPLDTWHTVGDALTGLGTTFAASAGWAAYTPVQFRKYPDGKVKLRGVARNMSSAFTYAAGNVIFLLPAAYRPAVAQDAEVIVTEPNGTTNSVAQCRIGTDGSVTLITTVVSINGITGGTGSYVRLDNFEFDTDSVNSMPAGPSGPSGPPVVTSLPVAPADDTRVLYRFTQTVNPVDSKVITWHLRYDAAISAWLPVGEQEPLYGYDDPQRSFAFSSASVWGNISTADPSANVPLAGDYKIDWGCASSLTSAANINQWIGIQIAGVDPGVNTGLTISGGTTSSAWWPTSRGSWKASSLTTGTLIKMRWMSQTTASTLYRAGAYLLVYPRRITGN